MPQLQHITLILLLTTSVFAMQTDFDLKHITFNSLAFSTTKASIIKAFGPGEKIETDYECGFFVNDQEWGPYYQLKYEYFNYIGSDKEKFYLEHVHFDKEGKTTLLYGHHRLNGQTSRSTFIKIFGEKAEKHFKEHPEEESILLQSESSDDGAIFTFKDNRLISFAYWSPC